MHPVMSTRAGKKPRKCKVCRETYTPTLPMQRVCAPACGILLSRAAQDAQRERKRLREAREHRAKKESIKRKSEWISEAEAAVRLYCRVRDAADPCISCGRSVAEIETGGYKPGGYWDGGHFLSKGSNPAIRFCTWNIHKQCKSCNGGAGQYVKKNTTISAAYKERLIVKVGAERVAWLEGPHKPLQPNVEYLKRIKTIFNKRARHIKKLRGNS